MNGPTEVTAGAPGLLKAINIRAVLETVDRHGPLTRAQLRRATGLSKTAIAQTVPELLERGVVVDVGFDDETGGPAAVLYAIARGAATGGALDITRGTVRAAVFDLGTGVRGRAVESAAESAVDIADAAFRALERAATDAGLTVDGLDHIVVGVPGVVGPDDVIRLAPGLPDDGAGLASALRHRLGDRVTLENDTNLAAVAELRLGAALGVADFAFLFVGESVGSGLVLDGRLHRGRRGAAGEVAYLPGPAGETDASLGMASVRSDAEALGAEAPTDPAELFLRARIDPQLAAVVEHTAERVARATAALGLVLDPELVVLGGSIGAGDPSFVEAVSRILVRDHPEVDVEIVASDIGTDAVLRGAVELGRDRIRDAVFAAAAAGGSDGD
ncbi:ROK family transcriptional regulator [Homoserinibacter sp. GY 40078]|uniref:ROK family transcriptional regulator n=1 Tax=Homoserinibacter sp. GY 40078 TaxID=2603275 RepID=UPI0011CBEA62|nr:ROK family transcriptional regulator [Homoserinibacter sp. GY 40078]TXK18802.1 ROK family transcriptional regulator [Homoserinibacter sp. GY 40078]